MAIFDAYAEFCDAVSVAVAAGTSLIGNQIDSSVVRDLGRGKPVYLVITVDTTIATGGSAGTIQFALASDDSASIHTTTSTRHLLTPAYVTDDSPDIDAGSVLFCGPIPDNGYAAYERYLGILLIVGTTTITAGKVNAFLTLDPVDVYKAYPQATVS